MTSTSLHATCPYCDYRFDFAPSEAGKKARCPKCQGISRLPIPDAISPAPPTAPTKPPREVELTSKVIKKQMLAGCLVQFVGACMTVVGLGARLGGNISTVFEMLASIGIGLTVIGVGVYGNARFRKWWEHE